MKRAPLPALGSQPWHPPEELSQALFVENARELAAELREARLELARSFGIGLVASAFIAYGLWVGLAGVGRAAIPTGLGLLVLGCLGALLSLHVLEDARWLRRRAYRAAERALARRLRNEGDVARRVRDLVEHDLTERGRGWV